MKIKCPLCGFENEEYSKFCENCNEPLTKQSFSKDSPYIKKEDKERKDIAPKRKNYYGFLVVLLLFFVILYYFLPIFLEEPTQKTVYTTESTTKTSKLTPVATWHEVARWQGKSMKNTETFHIPSFEWRILWLTKPGEYGDMNFQIYVYNSAGSLIDVAANVIGENKDSSFMRGSGDYYLKINTGQPYTIIIEAKY